jgi:hypothetical protein
MTDRNNSASFEETFGDTVEKLAASMLLFGYGPDGTDLAAFERRLDKIMWDSPLTGEDIAGWLIDLDLAIYDGGTNRITAAEFAGDCGDACTI